MRNCKVFFFRNSLFWVVLGLNLKKNYFHIWNQRPQIFQNAKFHVKQKKFKFRTKIDKFEFLGCSFKKVLSYLKPKLSNLWNWKVAEIRNLWIWDQKYLWIVLGRNLKKLLSYLKSGPSNFCKRKVLCKSKNH